MVLVIYGHLLYGGIWSIVNRAIYSFHMPMYFVLSGYVAHRRTTTLKSYFSRKAYELLLPSAIFIVATLPIYYFFTRDSGTNLSEHLKTILFVNGQVAYNSPIWFLIVLFQIIVVFEIIRGIQYPIPVKAVTALLLFVLGYLVQTKLLFVLAFL